MLDNDPSQQTAPGIGAAQAASASTRERMMEQNFPAGIMAGLLAAVIGAAIWAAISVATERQIGYMAIGMGALVGIAVRKLGKGYDMQFGIAGALLALLGCLIGNYFMACGFIAKELEIGVLGAMGSLNPGGVVDLLRSNFDGMDVLFLGIAAYTGFRISRIDRPAEPSVSMETA